jgi:hypothetical protein
VVLDTLALGVVAGGVGINGMLLSRDSQTNYVSECGDRHRGLLL